MSSNLEQELEEEDLSEFGKAYRQKMAARKAFRRAFQDAYQSGDRERTLQIVRENQGEHLLPEDLLADLCNQISDEAPETLNKIELLLAGGADVNTTVGGTQHTVLMMACKQNQVYKVAILLHFNPDLELGFKQFMGAGGYAIDPTTALDLAFAETVSPNIVAILLRSSAYDSVEKREAEIIKTHNRLYQNMGSRENTSRTQ